MQLKPAQKKVMGARKGSHLLFFLFVGLMEIIEHDFVIRAQDTMHLQKGPWLWLHSRLASGPGWCLRSWTPPAHGQGHPGGRDVPHFTHEARVAQASGNLDVRKQGDTERGGGEKTKQTKTSNSKNNNKKPHTKTAEERETPKFSVIRLQNISRFGFH